VIFAISININISNTTTTTGINITEGGETTELDVITSIH
jgi:hypothetical protein